VKVWRNAEDTRREYPIQREDGTWLYASWGRYPPPVGGWHECVVHGAGFATEGEAVDWIERFLDREAVTTIEVATPTEGWPEAVQWRAPEGSPEIEEGQVWYRGKRAAVVEGYAPMHPHGALGVLARFVESRGTSGRLAAAHWYREQEFRRLYRIQGATPEVSPIVHGREPGSARRRRGRRGRPGTPRG